MRRLSFNMTEIVKTIIVWTNKGNKFLQINGSDMTVDLQPIYPFCYMLDLEDYFDFKKEVPLAIHFYFNVVRNVGVTLHVDDKIRALRKRVIKYVIILWATTEN